MVTVQDPRIRLDFGGEPYPHKDQLRGYLVDIQLH